MFEFTNSARQTETIREHEHLRYLSRVERTGDWGSGWKGFGANKIPSTALRQAAGPGGRSMPVTVNKGAMVA